MGWDSSSKGSLSAKEYVRKSYVFENERVKSEVVKDALVNRGTYYALVKVSPKEEGAKPLHYLAVALVRYYPSSDYDISVKHMDESMGPCEKNCPKAILDLADELSPLNDENDRNGYARAYRAACRERLNRRAKAAKPGDVLKFPEPLSFGNGAFSADMFKLVKEGRRMYFRTVPDGRACRIPRWKDRAYEVVAGA